MVALVGWAGLVGNQVGLGNRAADLVSMVAVPAD